MRGLKSLLVAVVLMVAGAASAQPSTATATGTNTQTPTVTVTRTPTKALGLPTISAEQARRINQGGGGQENVGGMLQALTAAVNGNVSLQVAAGTNAADVALPEPGVRQVVAILAVTTSTGAFATKALLAPTTDYTVANGRITTVGDKSAVTLLIFYRR